VTVTCQPASGSTFPIGTTLVTCTASDGVNSAVSCTFTITVNGAAEQVGDLIGIVNALPKVPVTIKNGLASKLQAALNAYNANNIATACTAMQDFLNLVNAQAGKKQISTALANDLITAARRIRSVIGCP
jgi:hypothetical protein